MLGHSWQVRESKRPRLGQVYWLFSLEVSSEGLMWLTSPACNKNKYWSYYKSAWKRHQTANYMNEGSLYSKQIRHIRSKSTGVPFLLLDSVLQEFPFLPEGREEGQVLSLQPKDIFFQVILLLLYTGQFFTCVEVVAAVRQKKSARDKIQIRWILIGNIQTKDCTWS